MFAEKHEVVTQEKCKRCEHDKVWCASYLLDFGEMLNRTLNPVNASYKQGNLGRQRTLPLRPARKGDSWVCAQGGPQRFPSSSAPKARAVSQPPAPRPQHAGGLHSYLSLCNKDSTQAEGGYKTAHTVGSKLCTAKMCRKKK